MKDHSQNILLPALKINYNLRVLKTELEINNVKK
jgi:hypothetical protein